MQTMQGICADAPAATVAKHRTLDELKSPIQMDPVIHSLWIGTQLSTMEQLSISSFLKNGHRFHLYVYDDVAAQQFRQE